MKKYFIVFLVGGFGIMTGLEIKEIFQLSFENSGYSKELISCLLYFSMMVVLFIEWLKILNHEKAK